jgi:predicted nuclease with TOPRIM domain
MSFDETFEKQLVEAYDKSARHFSQLFNATLIFAFAFLAFILVPLVALQREDATIDQAILAAKIQTSKAEAEQKELASQQAETKAMLGNLPAQREELVRRQKDLEDQDAKLAQDIEAVELSLDKLTQEQGRLEEMLITFNRIARATNELQPLDVEAFVRELQDFLRRFADVIWNGAPPEGLDLDASCPGHERADCIIRAKVMQMLTATEQKLREQVVAPLAGIDAATADALEARLKATHENFGHVLDQQPGFWQAVVHKRDVGQEFAQEIARLSADISAALFDKIKQLGQEVGKIQLRQSELLQEAGTQQQEIERLRQVKAKSESDIAALAAQITEAETKISAIEQKIADGRLKVAESNEQIAALTAKQAKIVAERQAISDRMKGVQSPFGALPIGLTEAVQVFPVIVAVGFIMALLTLASAMRLRSRYHVLLRKKYPAEAGDVDERVVLTAPLFIDPFRRPDENAWRCAVLALPVIVYAVAILLIAESQRLAPQTEGTGRFIENGYGWLYFGVAVLLVPPLYQVAKAWSKYEPASGRGQTTALRARPLDNAHLSGQAGS